LITFDTIIFTIYVLDLKTPDKDYQAPETSESVPVEQPSDVDLDDSVQITPGDTPSATGDEVQEVIEADNQEGIIQPEVGPPEVAASVIVLT